MRVVPRKACLSSLFGDEGHFLLLILRKGAANMKETLEQIRREALAALSETKTAADLEAL